MSKYKVGDRVWSEGNIPGYKGMGVIVEVDEGHPRSEYKVKYDKGKPHNGVWALNESVKSAASPKIVITTDGKTTLARLYDGNKVIKCAEAKCSPSDTFAFFTGAKWAFDRLTEEPKQTEEKKPEPVKLYCVEEWGFFKKGETYTIEPDGTLMLNGYRDRHKDFEDVLSTHPATKGKVFPLVKRPAKVGEWVYVLHTSYEDELCAGDISRVISAEFDGRAMIAKHRNLYPRGLCYLQSEYLVLDGYRAKGK